MAVVVATVVTDVTVDEVVLLTDVETVVVDVVVGHDPPFGTTSPWASWAFRALALMTIRTNGVLALPVRWHMLIFRAAPLLVAADVEFVTVVAVAVVAVADVEAEVAVVVCGLPGVSGLPGGPSGFPPPTSAGLPGGASGLPALTVAGMITSMSTATMRTTKRPRMGTSLISLEGRAALG